MALKPITRQEQIIAGKDLQPITRMEKFLKEYGGGGGNSSPPDYLAAEGEPGHILNRPFYTETVPGITFTAEDIANSNELVTYPGGQGEILRKVSNQFFTREMLSGMHVDGVFNGSVLSDNVLVSFANIDCYVIRTAGRSYFIGFYAVRDCVVDDIALSAGLWIYSDEHTAVTSVSIPDGKIVHQIPSEYLPRSGDSEKTWTLFSPEDDDVNFVIAEIDSLIAGNPVLIDWNTIKTMRPNEIMRRLVGNYGGSACTGVYVPFGDADIEGVCVSFQYMGKSFSNEGLFTTQTYYYNITADGIEYYGYTDAADFALIGGTLEGPLSKT